MVGFATVVMAGRVNRDPELRYAPGDVPVVNFGVTVHRKNGFGESLTFVECRQRGDGAEGIRERYKRGDAVRIEGSLRTERFRRSAAEDETRGRLVVDVAIMEMA